MTSENDTYLNPAKRRVAVYREAAWLLILLAAALWLVGLTSFDGTVVAMLLGLSVRGAD